MPNVEGHTIYIIEPKGITLLLEKPLFREGELCYISPKLAGFVLFYVSFRLVEGWRKEFPENGLSEDDAHSAKDGCH